MTPGRRVLPHALRMAWWRAIGDNYSVHKQGLNLVRLCDCAPPNGLPFSRRKRAAQEGIKKGPISRAQRSAGTAGWVAAPLDAQALTNG
jgi:hypothetical protein